jgi:DmsE family decaheme c-type cytochrome
MRIFKIVLVNVFALTSAALYLSPKVAAYWSRDDYLLKNAIGVLISGESQPKNSAQKQPKNIAQLANADQYIGSDACAECHTDIAAFFSVTVHRKTLSEDGQADMRGCEACHGPAKTHIEYQKGAQTLMREGKEEEANKLLADETKAAAAKMRSFDELSSAAASAICLKCHEGTQGRNEERFNFRRSEHYRHGVSCIDCHSSHSPKRTEFLLRAPEPEGCYRCHGEQKTSFARPFHHKVPEGGMRCSDCHNQHGSFVNKQLRTWANSDVNCIKCHADKSGPFVYEHGPIKVEGCQACHTPHGSTNPKLLKRNEVRFLCLECHSNAPGAPGEQGEGPATPSFHNLADPRGRFLNCTTCHVMIHGSNASPVYFR